MRFISRFVYVVNTLSGGVTAKTKHNSTLNHTDAIETPETKQPPRAKPRARRVDYSPEFIQNHTLLDFDLPEALRLRALGWGNRRIARQMNNVGKDTVRKRLREYDERVASQQSIINPVIKQPSIPPQQAPMPSPVVTLTVPAPVTNFDDLFARRKSQGLQDYPFDLSHVFLTRPEHLKFALGSEQPCITFDRWRDEYHLLEIFQKPERFYVLVVAEDGHQINRPWLDSLASDIWLRERCLVHRIPRGNPLTIYQSRYSAHRQYRAQAYGARLADETFERWHKFEPMPLHSHHDLLAALSKDAVPIAKPQEIGPYSTGWTAQASLPPQAGWIDDGCPQRSEGAGGLCTGGDDTDNWK